MVGLTYKKKKNQCNTSYSMNENKNHMITTMNTNEEFDKIQRPFVIESITNLKRGLPQSDKGKTPQLTL